MTEFDDTTRTRVSTPLDNGSLNRAEYTNQPRQSPYTAYLGSPDTHIGATQPIAVRKGLFDGISVAQVIAASAAAATSMLLASRIGIAGSVIGAAVSSMVTVICSQLYRNALDASAQKLKAKQTVASHTPGSANNYAQGAQSSEHAGEGVPGAQQPGNRVRTARIAPTKLQARAAAERSAAKRKVAVASVLIAAAAVAVCAGFIMLGTAGEGLGAKAPALFGNAAHQQQAPADPADELIPSAPTPEAPDGSQGTDGQTATPDDSADHSNGPASNPSTPSDQGSSSSGSGSTATPDAGAQAPNGSGDGAGEAESGPADPNAPTDGGTTGNAGTPSNVAASPAGARAGASSQEA